MIDLQTTSSGGVASRRVLAACAASLAVYALAPGLAHAEPQVAIAETPARALDGSGFAREAAAADEASSEVDPEGDPHRPLGVAIEAGPRFLGVSDAGFDPYSEGDVLPLAAIDVVYTPFRLGALEVGAIAGYAVGQTGAVARGDATELTLHRMSVGLAGRIDLIDRFSFRAQVVPSAQFVRASIDDAFVDRPLLAHVWTYGLDTTLGLAVRLGSVDSHGEHVVSFWLAGDAGYSFAGSAPMKLRPDEDDDDPRVYGALELPDVHLAGPSTRFALGVAF